MEDVTAHQEMIVPAPAQRNEDGQAPVPLIFVEVMIIPVFASLNGSTSRPGSAMLAFLSAFLQGLNYEVSAHKVFSLMKDARTRLDPFFPHGLPADQATRLNRTTMIVEFWNELRPCGCFIQEHSDKRMVPSLEEYRGIAIYLELNRELFVLTVTPPPPAPPLQPSVEVGPQLLSEQAPVQALPEHVVQPPSPTKNMVQEPLPLSSQHLSPKKTPTNFNLNSQTSETSYEAPKTPGPVQAKPPVKLNFDFASQAPPSFGTTTPQEALKPSSPMQKQKAPAVQQPTKHTLQLLEFNAMTWCLMLDDELKELTWSRFSFSGEQQARLLILGHSANASLDSSIKLRALGLKQQENRRNVQEELNRVAMRFEHATVVLLVQADLAKRDKKHSSIAPLINKFFTFVKGAAVMTRACRGGVTFHSGDGWYDAARLFNDEIIAEPPVWELLKSKYDRKTMKALQKVWLENEPHWAGPVA